MAVGRGVWLGDSVEVALAHSVEVCVSVKPGLWDAGIGEDTAVWEPAATPEIKPESPLSPAFAQPPRPNRNTIQTSKKGRKRFKLGVMGLNLMEKIGEFNAVLLRYSVFSL